MTPTLSALHDLARELEVSDEIERGLVFSLALFLCMGSADPRMNAEYARRRARLTPYADDPLENRGVDFDGNRIGELMFECVQKLGDEVSPRLIRLSSGASFPSYNSPSEDRLPRLTGESLDRAGCERLAQSVFAQIGEAINEDLEGAFIAGLRFVSSYGRVDSDTTVVLIGALETAMPPPYAMDCPFGGIPP
ncbi:hypothetical protein EON81_25730 [bacterium]|nr:MAG: hypothetical protein EON81_25730 [bacterium]